MPYTCAAFVIAAISMIGVPPSVGFVSKLYIILASLEAKQFVFVAVLLLSSLLNLVYFWRVIETMYMKVEEGTEHTSHVPRDEIPLSMLIPVLTLSSLCILMGILWLTKIPIPILNRVNVLFGLVGDHDRYDGVHSTPLNPLVPSPGFDPHSHLRQTANVREAWTLLASCFQFLIVLSMVRRFWMERRWYVISLRCFRGLTLVFMSMPLVSCLRLQLLPCGSWSPYTPSVYARIEGTCPNTVLFLFALAILGAVGVALSGNLVTMYIFYEILTVSTYPLVAHEQSPEALFAGRKYLAYLLTGGTFLLGAIALTYSIAGTTDFRPGGIFTGTMASRSMFLILFVLFIIGFMKAAYMPFHSWLPTAMVAPTPVSALLHAVAVVKAGVFGIVRTVAFIYGVDLMQGLGLGILLASFAGFTMIVASLLRLPRTT